MSHPHADKTNAARGGSGNIFRNCGNRSAKNVPSAASDDGTEWPKRSRAKPAPRLDSGVGTTVFARRKRIKTRHAAVPIQSHDPEKHAFGLRPDGWKPVSLTNAERVCAEILLIKRPRTRYDPRGRLPPGELGTMGARKGPATGSLYSRTFARTNDQKCVAPHAPADAVYLSGIAVDSLGEAAPDTRAQRTLCRNHARLGW
jgi:hypothetical protein